MHRRAGYDARAKKWDASLYMLGDRPSDGKLVPMLSSVGSMNTEAQVSIRLESRAETTAKQTWDVYWGSRFSRRHRYDDNTRAKGGVIGHQVTMGLHNHPSLKEYCEVISTRSCSYSVLNTVGTWALLVDLHRYLRLPCRKFDRQLGHEVPAYFTLPSTNNCT